MPRVQNTSLGTVTTDGVTIQGTGASASPIAIKQVETDATLTGAGTVASPLSAVTQTPAGWPLTWWVSWPTASTSSVALPNTANKVELYGIVIAAQVRFAKIIIDIATADNANSYDWGLYTYAGALVANIGPVSIAGTGLLSSAVLQGTVTINPGRYYFATTGNATTAHWNSQNSGSAPTVFLHSTTAINSSAGTLPGSLTPPADSPTTSVYPCFALST